MMAKPPAKKPASRKKAKEEAPPAELAPAPRAEVAPLGAQLDFPANPNVDDEYAGWRWDGTRWRRIPTGGGNGGGGGSGTLGVAFVWPIRPLSTVPIYVPMPFAITIPPALAGSRCVSTAPALNVNFVLYKYPAPPALQYETLIGTITIGAGPGGQQPGSISFSGPGAEVAAGETLFMKPPDPQDANLLAVSITILAERA